MRESEVQEKGEREAVKREGSRRESGMETKRWGGGGEGGGCFSYTISVHFMTSHVHYIRYRLQHTCYVYLNTRIFLCPL